MLTREGLADWLRKDWRRRGVTVPDDGRIGVAWSEVVELSAERNSGLATPYVDLWVAILDEFLVWESSLLNAVYVERKSGAGFTDFERAVTMLLMKVIADTASIRHLILAGYDTSARTILRSTGEYLETLVALIDDPDLAEDFVLSDSPDGAKAFWEKHLRGDKLRRRMKRAWRRFFREQPESEETGLWFAGWGAQFQQDLSGLLHPSYAGGMLTVLPPNRPDEKESWLGIWGNRSNSSVTTVFIYASFMFPLLMLNYGFPFSGFDDRLGAVLAYDESNEFHRHLREGRNVLASLVVSLSKETNREHILPGDNWDWLDQHAEPA